MNVGSNALRCAVNQEELFCSELVSSESKVVSGCVVFIVGSSLIGMGIAAAGFSGRGMIDCSDANSG